MISRGLAANYSEAKAKKICIVATVPYAINMFMMPHILMLSKQHHVTIIANGSDNDYQCIHGENIRLITVKFSRKISLWRDLLNLIQLICIFHQEHFDVVHSLMPKTGLLAMLAARITNTTYRIHTFTGQVWANKVGFMRWLLKTLDQLTASSATHLLTDGFPQLDYLVNQEVVSKCKIRVLASGSTRGVDVDRFKPNKVVRDNIRCNLNIPVDAIVYIFLGRLNRDKGIYDLACAFVNIAKKIPTAHLLVVGPDEGNMDEILQSKLSHLSQRFHRVGYTEKPEDYLASADIFCLPSYREGFPSVIIEAASVGLPSIASNIYGVVDAVKNNETGLLHEPGNINDISNALVNLTNDSELRIRLATQAKQRAHQYFRSEILVNEMQKFYAQLFNE
jgi:glycosyltransferase involved in cell wall biosynthesis